MRHAAIRILAALAIGLTSTAVLATETSVDTKISFVTLREGTGVVSLRFENAIPDPAQCDSATRHAVIRLGAPAGSSGLTEETRLMTHAAYMAMIGAYTVRVEIDDELCEGGRPVIVGITVEP